MSNEWTLLCQDCGDEWTGPCTGFNNGGPWLDDLAKYMPLLAYIQPTIATLDELLSTEALGIEFPAGLLDFATKHHRHRLTPKDEYGKLFGDCGDHFDCPCCGTRLKCNYKKNHGGNHGRKKV